MSIILSKESNIFLKQHGENINDPADSEETVCKHPDKPYDHSAADYPVDTLKNRIKKNRADKTNYP